MSDDKVIDLKNQGKQIVGYGAPGKGTRTLGVPTTVSSATVGMACASGDERARRGQAPVSRWRLRG